MNLSTFFLYIILFRKCVYWNHPNQGALVKTLYILVVIIIGLAFSPTVVCQTLIHYLMFDLTGVKKKHTLSIRINGSFLRYQIKDISKFKSISENRKLHIQFRVQNKTINKFSRIKKEPRDRFVKENHHTEIHSRIRKRVFLTDTTVDSSQN